LTASKAAIAQAFEFTGALADRQSQSVTCARERMVTGRASDIQVSAEHLVEEELCSKATLASPGLPSSFNFRVFCCNGVHDARTKALTRSSNLTNSNTINLINSAL
jgi:hypothetical protein